MIIKTININSFGKVTVGGWVDEDDQRDYPDAPVERRIKGSSNEVGLDEELRAEEIIELGKLLQALSDKHAEPDPSTWYDVENL